MTSPTTQDLPVLPTLTIDALSRLDGAATPEPFVLGVASKRIVFPDPLAMDATETERFMRDIESMRWPMEVFRRWLTPEDYQVLIDAHLTGRQAALLMRKASRHYQEFYGDQGEGTASGTS